MTQAVALPPGFRLVALEITESTNDDARRLAATASPEEIVVVWARTQTAGRGRRGRSWRSEPGNLYCSFLIRHDGPAARAPELGFVAVVAAAETLEGLVAEPVTCKWPNDVLIAGKKAVGILPEAETRRAAAPWLIVGIGINVSSHPPDTRTPATSIAEAGGTASVEQTLHALAARFADQLEIWRRDGFDPVREAWSARASGIGQSATVELGGETVTGMFAGLDVSGAMLLDTAEGPRRIAAGEVYFAPVEAET